METKIHRMAFPCIHFAVTMHPQHNEENECVQCVCVHDTPNTVNDMKNQPITNNNIVNQIAKIQTTNITNEQKISFPHCNLTYIDLIDILVSFHCSPYIHPFSF